MDALVPAFVATALAEFGGAASAVEKQGTRPAWIVLFVALIAAVAATGGWFVAGELTPEARTLMLGLALVCAGAFPGEAKPGWKGALGTARALLGGGAPFLIFAFALRAATPALAAAGGLMGMLAAILAAPLAAGLPIRPVRAAIRLLLIVAGIVTGLAGLRLI